MSSEKPRPLVVSGPSGSGKSTLLNRLFAEFPETFGFSVSHTTRPPRPGEEDGKQYHFMDRENFQKMVDEGKFIEHAEFGGNLYGTSVEAIKAVAKATKIAVLDVDMQGVKSVKNTDLNARFVFIKPPSVDVLEQRLRERGTETEQAIKDRLAMATAELEYAAQPGTHDLVIVNESLDDAYKQLKEYVVGITGALPAAAAAADGNKSAAADENKSAAADENKNAAADESKSAAADQPPTEPGGLAIAGPQPGASASPSSASAASPAPADAPKSGKKGQDKKEKEAAEKAKKEKAKEEKAAIKAKEKEEKAKKSKGGAKGKGPASPTADTGAEAGAAGGSDAAAPSAAGKKSKTCTIL